MTSTSSSAAPPLARGTWALDPAHACVQAFFDRTLHGGFAATAEIRRANFGLDFGALGAALGKVVEVQLDLQFIEPR
jgi:polyisoprenoid-binding protein YceI